MNCRKLLMAVLCAAGAASCADAQMVYLNENMLDYYSNPYRGRGERTSDARLEALQMSYAIDDEASQFTLEGWADNRAGLADSQKNYVKVNAGGQTGDLHDSNDYTGGNLGAYMRAGGWELEGGYTAQKIKNSSGDDTYDSPAAGIGYGHSFGNLSAGAHANFERGNYESDVNYNINSAGVGGAYKLDLGGTVVDMGTTLDYVARGNQTSFYTRPLHGANIGAAAIASVGSGLKAGLRASFAPLSGDCTGTMDGVTKKSDPKTLGARVQYLFSAIPLTLVGDFSRYYENPRYSAASYISYKTGSNLFTGGAALKLLDGKLLVGTELQKLELTQEMLGTGPSTYRDDVTNITGGAEYYITQTVALRGSFRRMKYRSWYEATPDNVTENKSNSFAFGAGYKGEKALVDLTFKYVKDNLDTDSEDKYKGLWLTASFPF